MRKRPREGHRDWLWEVTINHLVISFNKDCLEFQLCPTLYNRLPQWLSCKESFCSTEDVVDHWVRKISWRRKGQPIPVFLHGESQGQRILVGYSRKGCKESDMIEQLSVRTYTHTHTHTLYRWTSE